MANIPEYFATEQMETSQMPRAPMGIADVGAGMDAIALARFGGALKDFSLDRLQQIINIETQSQYTAGKAAWQEEETKFLLELEKDQNFEGYDEKYKAKVKELRSQILTKGLTSDAKQALNDYIETQKAALGKKVAGQYLMKERDYARASTYEAVRIFEMAGEAGKAKAALIEGRKAGYLGAEETSRRISQVEENTAMYQRQKFIDNTHNVAKAMPYKEAIGFLNDIEGLTSAERNDLIRRRERQEEIVNASTNDLVRWKLIREASDPNNAKTMTDEYIESYIKPNSITGSDAEQIASIRDSKDTPLKTPRAQIYFKHLEDLYKNKDIETIQEYDTKMEQLTQFFKANPNPTPKQTAEFFDTQIHNVAEKFLDMSWKWWVQSPFGIGYRKIAGIKKETKSPYPEYPDAFEEDGVWKVIRDGKKYRIE